MLNCYYLLRSTIEHWPPQVRYDDNIDCAVPPPSEIMVDKMDSFFCSCGISSLYVRTRLSTSFQLMNLSGYMMCVAVGIIIFASNNIYLSITTKIIIAAAAAALLFRMMMVYISQSLFAADGAGHTLIC